MHRAVEINIPHTPNFPVAHGKPHGNEVSFYHGNDLVQIATFDLRGRLIVMPLDRLVTGVENEVRWDGRDRQGKPEPTGAYLVKLTTETTEDVTLAVDSNSGLASIPFPVRQLLRHAQP